MPNKNKVKLANREFIRTGKAAIRVTLPTRKATVLSKIKAKYTK